MPKWLQKSIVVLVTVLTFGLVTPTGWFDIHSLDEKPSKRDVIEPGTDEKRDIESHYGIEEHQELTEQEKMVEKIILEAKAHSFEKFGPRIKPVIEDEFLDLILPNMQKAIEQVAIREDDSLRKLVITEGSTGGDSERIFHIGDMLTNEEIIRFHVRRDHPPQAGYWFNFHYHTFHDNFMNHYELGTIYWDKNTPPKWMS